MLPGPRFVLVLAISRSRGVGTKLAMIMIFKLRRLALGYLADDLYLCFFREVRERERERKGLSRIIWIRVMESVSDRMIFFWIAEDSCAVCTLPYLKGRSRSLSRGFS